MEFSREVVIKKVRKIFPKEDEKKILSILDLYGVNPNETERERIQLAILKLSQGKEEMLRKYVELVKIDFAEDILWPAEEPNLYALGEKIADMNESEIKQLQEKDRKQYMDWLNE